MQVDGYRRKAQAQAGGSADGVAGAQDIARLRLRLRWRIQRGFLAGGRGAGGWAAGRLWSRSFGVAQAPGRTRAKIRNQS